MKTQHKHKVLASQFPEDARVHYTVLKQQPTHQQQTTTTIIHHQRQAKTGTTINLLPQNPTVYFATPQQRDAKKLHAIFHP